MCKDTANHYKVVPNVQLCEVVGKLTFHPIPVANIPNHWSGHDGSTPKRERQKTL